MDEPLTGAIGVPLLPRGVAVRYSGVEAPGLWHQVVALPDGRVGLALGRAADPRQTERGSGLADTLLATGDPRRALDVLRPGSAAVCAVITSDGCAMCFCSRPGAGPEPLVAVARPRTAPESLVAAETAENRLRLAPGATLLLSSRADGRTVAVLGEGSGEPPHRCAAMLADSLAESDPATDLVMLYRCAPEPLNLSMRAEPKNLAVVRDRMRQWLGLAGVDAEATADALLAVGEAASNCTEHAIVGVSRPVELTVRAAVDGSRLRLVVSDNGRWKAVTPTTGTRSHRGHGMKLITALVDAADVTTDDRGTTVEMLKELRP